MVIKKLGCWGYMFNSVEGIVNYSPYPKGFWCWYLDGEDNTWKLFVYNPAINPPSIELIAILYAIFKYYYLRDRLRDFYALMDQVEFQVKVFPKDNMVVYINYRKESIGYPISLIKTQYINIDWEDNYGLDPAHMQIPSSQLDYQTVRGYIPVTTPYPATPSFDCESELAFLYTFIDTHAEEFDPQDVKDKICSFLRVLIGQSRDAVIADLKFAVDKAPDAATNAIKELYTMLENYPLTRAVDVYLTFDKETMASVVDAYVRNLGFTCNSDIFVVAVNNVGASQLVSCLPQLLEIEEGSEIVDLLNTIAANKGVDVAAASLIEACNMLKAGHGINEILAYLNDQTT